MIKGKPKGTGRKSKSDGKDKEVEAVIKDYLWWKRFVVKPEREAYALDGKDKKVKVLIKDYLWWKRFVVKPQKGKSKLDRKDEVVST